MSASRRKCSPQDGNVRYKTEMLTSRRKCSVQDRIVHLKMEMFPARRKCSHQDGNVHTKTEMFASRQNCSSQDGNVPYKTEMFTSKRKCSFQDGNISYKTEMFASRKLGSEWMRVISWSQKVRKFSLIGSEKLRCPHERKWAYILFYLWTSWNNRVTWKLRNNKIRVLTKVACYLFFPTRDVSISKHNNEADFSPTMKDSRWSIEHNMEVKMMIIISRRRWQMPI